MTATIVVGVTPNENDAVFHVAASFARAFGAELVFVTSDDRHYPIAEGADGAVTSLDIDPDDPEEYVE